MVIAAQNGAGAVGVGAMVGGVVGGTVGVGVATILGGGFTQLVHCIFESLPVVGIQ